MNRRKGDKKKFRWILRGFFCFKKGLFHSYTAAVHTGGSWFVSCAPTCTLCISRLCRVNKRRKDTILLFFSTKLTYWQNRQNDKSAGEKYMLHVGYHLQFTSFLLLSANWIACVHSSSHSLLLSLLFSISIRERNKRDKHRAWHTRANTHKHTRVKLG